MKTILTLSVLALALALPAAAQLPTFTQTLPIGYDAQDGNYTVPDGGNFGAAVGQRWQYAYRWTNFQHQCPIAITEISLRNNSDANMQGGTYTNVSVQLASGLNTFNTMSTIYANNLDPADLTTVFMGDVTIPAYTAAGATTAPFNVNIPFNTGFFYFDPSRQKDLVIDITTAGATTPSGFAADGVFSASVTGSQTGHRTDHTAPVATWQNYDACAVLEIKYTLGSPIHFNMDAFTTGGGVGDFVVQLTNIPSGTTEGFTLVSFVPNPTLFGTGPVWGLFPDLQVFLTITQPAVLGGPFHWLYPAGPFWPDTPIVFPAGTMTALTGQTWEMVSVALDAQGIPLAWTAPVSVTF